MLRYFSFFLSLLALAIWVLFLSGCETTGNHNVPVIEAFNSTYKPKQTVIVSKTPPKKSAQASKKSASKVKKSKPPSTYKVKKGDTLYSIAWVNQLDHRDLAKMNNLEPPYSIHPGQTIRTKLSFFESLKYKKKDTANRPAPILAQAELEKPPVLGFSQKQTLNKSVSAAKPKKTVVAQAKPKTSPKPKKQLAKKTRASKAKTSRSFASVRGWRWPSSGKVIENYSQKAGGNKGLDITHHYGSPVRAAASGQVVYSGSGLKGYGQLLLIKHNNSYLSAYGHNKRLLVKEGDRVRSGQKIAEMGRTNYGKPRLHFEIRKNGNPVNPMIHLASAKR